MQQPTYYYLQLLLTTTHLCRGLLEGYLLFPHVRSHEVGVQLPHMSCHQSMRCFCLGAAFLEHQSLPQSMECLQTQPAMLTQLTIIQINTYWHICALLASDNMIYVTSAITLQDNQNH